MSSQRVYHGRTTTREHADLDALWEVVEAAALAAAASDNQWGPNKAVGSFVGRNYTFEGGTAVVGSSLAQVADTRSVAWMIVEPA